MEFFHWGHDCPVPLSPVLEAPAGTNEPIIPDSIMHHPPSAKNKVGKSPVCHPPDIGMEIPKLPRPHPLAQLEMELSLVMKNM